MGELAKELEEINEKYELKEILSLNLKNKSAALLFKEKNGEKNCVMYIEKKYISESEIKNMVVCIKDTKLTFTNGPFFNFECCFDVPDLYTSTLIKPATDGMINKYRFSELYLFEETYEEYRKICLPYFLSQIHNNQWVHNILDGKTEQNRVLFKNDDFLVAADLKWDMKDMDKIYLLVILTRRDVYSLRQLDSSFLEILKTISLTCKVKDCYLFP
uniref:m7GpppX diphosphatase n=1 Tax=Henneguya salminicola TaxID=69463 RepID=A0A6G3MF60_HENSL